MGDVHADLAHEIAAGQTRQCPRALHDGRRVRGHRRDDALLRAVVPEMARQRPGVYALDADDAVLSHVVLDRHAPAPARRVRAGFLDDEAVDPRPSRLDVFRVDPVVANERVGHADELSTVRRVGHDLLVARHGRVEDDFTVGLAQGAAGPALEDAPVGQRQQRRR